MTIKISIQGKEPVKEVIEECSAAGWPIGTPIEATGQYNSIGLVDGKKEFMRGIWRYIWLGHDVRLPNALEEYLFRG